MGELSMFYEEELQYLTINKKFIVLHWFELLSKQHPNDFSFSDVEELAYEYFAFMIDFDIPPEEHPHFSRVLKRAEPSLLSTTTITHLLNSAQYFNDAFFKILIKYVNPTSALECFHILMFRQNVFMKRISEAYYHRSHNLIEEKDIKIDELHDDRLTLIGKMASSMAHEIRNPLTSIVGFLKLIRQNLINKNHAKLQEYIDVIDGEFESINMLITGFLSFSRNKAFVEDNVEISTSQLIHSTLILLNSRLTNENIQLFVEEAENYLIHVQKISIQQVLSNVISNAIDALITVHYPRELKIMCFEDEKITYIHIINNGPKIPKEMKDSLFIPFITNKKEGTGLGLAICKEIMAINNGAIDFISDDEETRFILSFRKQFTVF
jgi:two-component system, sporulation sensor kinase D